MFLNYLKEESKERFLKLCVHAALSNEIFEDEEKELIYAYCREMNMTEKIPDTSENLESILNDIAENSDSMEKNIILLEILGLVKADGIYDEKEKNFIEKVAADIKVREGLLKQINGLLEIYSTVCKELFNVITE